VAAASIAAATVLVAVLEQAAQIPDASAVYIVAVVIVGSVGGTGAALGTAIASFLVYDLLFTEPRLSLAISDTSELLNLVLVLIVALAVGRLAALGRERAGEPGGRG
jgi:two-component system sensor histidine kinase KdpD